MEGIPGIKRSRVDIGGYSLFVISAGTGAPTVVLEAGGGDSSDTWRMVQGRVARFTQAYAYDRAGFGRSDTGPIPSTSRQMVSELHSLLDRAQAPAPYVLVGHSFGALNVRLYAHRYPAEVAGMVLIDPAHEDIYGPLLASLGDPVHQGVDYATSAAQAVGLGDLGDLPLVVLTGANPMPGLPEEVVRMWLPCHRKLADLSSNRIHAIANRSGHFVQRDQPNLVAEAIHLVLAAVRDQTPLPHCGSTLENLGAVCVDQTSA